LQPLFETIVSTIPAATGDAAGHAADSGHQSRLLRILWPHRHLPRLSGHAARGRRRDHLQARRLADEDAHHQAVYVQSGLKRTETTETTMGDIIAVAGVEGITIGETITSVENPSPLPLIVIDEPTIAIQFSVNNSPFAGREGST
jgi:GTP-binding protein